MADNEIIETPAYKIFHKIIMVYIPASYAYETIHQFVGTPVYQNAEQEVQAAEEMVLQQRNLADIIELWDRGARVIFKNKADTSKCYQWIRDHLNEYRNASSTGMYVRNIPLRDLEKMDQFAQALYRVARNTEDHDLREPPMKRAMQSLFANRIMTRQRPPSKKELEEKEPQSDDPKADPEKNEHEPIVPDISKQVIDRRLNEI